MMDTPGTRAPNERSVLAARAALEAHSAALGIEGDEDCWLWHLLVSLHEYCGAHQLDFDRILAESKEGIASGELNVPAWDAFARARDRKVPTYPGLSEP